MRTRPLCMVCLIIFIVQTFMFLNRGGNQVAVIPTSSIFYEQDAHNVYIQGQVYKKKTTSNYQILYLKNNSVYDSKLMIYDETFTNISIGQYLSCKGTARAFQEARNPGNFDQALYYARQGFYGSVWCEEILDVVGKENLWQETLYKFKSIWERKLMNHMDKASYGLLSAILMGNKEQIDTDVKELYQKNGISHILAISGLHISFIGYGVYMCLKKLGMGYGFSGTIAVFLLFLYATMIGWSISVFRAFLMFLMKIGADITGRVYNMFTALVLAAVLTVAYEPLYLTEGGFYMSYLAVLGILILFPIFQTVLPKINFFLKGGIASLSVSIILLPVQLYFFYKVPAYSFLSNMLVVPFVSFLLGLGLVGSLFLFCCVPLGKLCLSLCHFILQLYSSVCEIGMKLPHARIVLGQPQIWRIFVYYVVFIFVLILIKRNWKIFKYSWLFLLVPICLFFPRKMCKLEVVMLDVGQGDAIYFQGPKGNTYLVDGGSSDVEQVGKYRIEPFLLSKGVGQLDYVFVTHGDADHYNGIKEMLERQDVGVHIKHLVFPISFKEDKELLQLAILGKEKGTKILVMDMGNQICEGELTFTCLQPGRKENLLGNAGSMVLEISYQSFSMLCTGDVEGQGEELLLKKIEKRNYDVLKVAHHGSKSSTTMVFLERINPLVALVSSGEGNLYGHPHGETIQRLKDVKCRIYQTAKNGAITVQTDGNSLTISLLPFRL